MIKVTTTRNVNNEGVVFPCLMDGHDGLLILATGREGEGISGTVLRSDDADIWALGRYSTGWRADRLTPFVGKITLENE